VCDTSRVLFQHGHAHRNVEPIQDVLKRSSDEFGQCLNLLAAIGQEGDILARLQTLIPEYVEQPALWLAIIS
jgi:hypothetical protein